MSEWQIRDVDSHRAFGAVYSESITVFHKLQFSGFFNPLRCLDSMTFASRMPRCGYQDAGTLISPYEYEVAVQCDNEKNDSRIYVEEICTLGFSFSILRI